MGTTTSFVSRISDFVRTRQRTFRLLTYVAVFCAALQGYWVSYVPINSVISEPESFRLAHNLYETGTFANPFPLSTPAPPLIYLQFFRLSWRC